VSVWGGNAGVKEEATSKYLGEVRGMRASLAFLRACFAALLCWEGVSLRAVAAEGPVGMGRVAGSTGGYSAEALRLSVGVGMGDSDEYC